MISLCNNQNCLFKESQSLTPKQTTVKPRAGPGSYRGTLLLMAGWVEWDFFGGGGRVGDRIGIDRGNTLITTGCHYKSRVGQWGERSAGQGRVNKLVIPVDG